jgi:hypothetical protein
MDHTEQFDEPDLYKVGDTGVKKPAVQDDLLTREAKANWAAYERARDAGHLDWVKEADKFDRYYMGDPWELADRKKLEDEGRPVLSINKILPTVSAWVGEQTSRRADVRFKPRKGGDSAFALTKLSMAIDDVNQLDWKETELFTDGCITDRGYYRVRMSSEKNIFGDIDIKVLNPRQVLLDPNDSEYDPKEWRSWTYIDWVSLDEITATYGKKKAEEIRTLVASDGGDNGPDSVLFTAHKFGSEHDDQSWMVHDGVHEGQYIKKVRILEREHYRYERVPHFVDFDTADTKPVPKSWDEARVAEFAQKMGLGVVKRTARQLYTTVSVDKIALFFEPSPYQTMSIIPYFPYFRRGKPMGVVRNLVDPQDQLNKLESQELHIVNSTANSGYTVEKGSLSNMTTDELYERGAETGIVIEHNPGTNPPLKIKPNQIPTGIDRISAKAGHHIKEISSITDAMLGLESPEVSGVALRAKTFRGSIQLAGPMDNLKRTRFLLTRKKLELIQQFYTEERIIQYTDESDPENPDQELIINQINAAGEILNDVTAGEYSFVIGTMPSRDTFEESQFADAIEMRQAGIMIPDDVIIESSTLQKKHEIAERVRRMAGQAAPTEDEVAMMQQQQQLSMQLQGLELAKLEQEVYVSMANVELLRAKAQKEANTDTRALDQLEEKLQEKREELQLRRDLSRLTSHTKLTQTDKNNDSKLITQLIAQNNPPQK